MDNLSWQLDEEFKDSLKFIRPYILRLTNADYITLCRIWLEKLNTCTYTKIDAKKIRNDYLNELCRQIQNARLEAPFTSQPPKGPLCELIQVTSNSWSDLSTISSKTELTGFGDAREICFENYTHNLNSHIEYQYEFKFKEMQQIIQDLNQKNAILTERLQEVLRELDSKNSEDSGVRVLANEVTYLKTRLKELMGLKKKLQVSHNAIVLQWENSMRNLESELITEKRKNTDLISTISALESKLQTSNVDTHNELKIHNDLQQKLVNAHNLEIETLKNKHEETINRMRNEFSEKLKTKDIECSEKLSELKQLYEEKMKNVYVETEKNLKFKDEEIARLEKMIESQCNRMQQEVVFIRSQMEETGDNQQNDLLEKISFLQKCILKMEKLLRRCEKHYTKKIVVLRKELEMKENSLKIQLTTQRAQILAAVSAERQVEIEAIVTQLEKRYRKLLEDQQSQANITRMHHLSIIKELSEKCDANLNVKNKTIS